MKLHQIKLRIRKQSKQRIGRGGKRGSYSGRGVKGQKSRAGRKLRPAERDLILRIPKLRGFRNKIKKDKPLIVNLADLNRIAGSDAQTPSPIVIHRGLFVKSGMVPARYAGEIKILSEGDVRIPIRVEGIAVSKKAKEKIEKAGGAVKEM